MAEWQNGVRNGGMAYGMAEWSNGKNGSRMAEWRNDKNCRMAEWWNGGMAYGELLNGKNGEDGGMAGGMGEWRPNGGMVEWRPNGRMVEWRNGRMARMAAEWRNG